MTASVRILSTSSVDSSPTILIVSPDGSKILVNCGEGTQRCFLEHAQKISSIQAVCLSHLGHTAIGGLPGALLTYADIDASLVSPTKSMDIIGPAGTQQFIHSLRHFMQRKDFAFCVHEGSVVKHRAKEASAKNRHVDSMPFSIQSFGIVGNDYEKHDEYGKGLHATTAGNKRPRPRPQSSPPAAAEQASIDSTTTTESPDQVHGPQSYRQEVLSFLFTSPPILGKFQAQKAVELGVPKGPLYGKLKNGQSITFTTSIAGGREVTVDSHQVVSPSTPGVAVLILYYPTRDVAMALMKSDELRKALEADIILEVTCHLTNDKDLMRQVISYMNDLVRPNQSEIVEHIFLSLNQPDLDGTPFRASAACAIARSCLCPDIYKEPRSQSMPETECPSDLESYRIGRSMMEYQMIPRSKKGFLRPPIVTSEAREFADKSKAAALAKQVHERVCSSNDGANSKGELVFTGTASALPCKYRNVTGMALKAENGHYFLLDVGESTIGTLLRTHDDLHGAGRLANIKGVWISHPHADHHLGLVRLLQERESKDPLILIAPPPLFRFLDDYSRVERGLSERYIGVDCWHLQEADSKVNAMLYNAFEFTDIRVVPVEHCSHAFAVIIDGTPFGRLVYSGDCRPSSKLALAAIGADLLIHEATFEDGMEAEALLKRHSTIGEALQVAHQMQAKATILTHFSQRYPKVPPVPASEQGSMPVIFAFDYMRLRPQTLATASQLTSAVRLLFPEQDETKVAEEKAKDIAKAEEALSTPGLFAMPGIL